MRSEKPHLYPELHDRADEFVYNKELHGLEHAIEWLERKVGQGFISEEIAEIILGEHRVEP